MYSDKYMFEINWLVPGGFDLNFRWVISTQILVIDGWNHLLWNCLQTNVTDITDGKSISAL